MVNSRRGGETCLPVVRLLYMLASENMYYTYVLNSQPRNYFYVGLTANVARRSNEHNGGKNKTTKPYRPFDILFVEEFDTRKKARIREKYLKSGSGKEYIKSLCRGGEIGIHASFRS